MPRLTKVELFREKNFLTLDDLAKRADLSIRTVWKAANGKDVSFKTAKKLAEVFGVGPEKLR